MILTPKENDMVDANGKKDVSLPPSEEERRRFIREHLRPLKRRPEAIADARYTGKWGTYSTDPTKSDWRVRQANRYLTELDRRRELWPVTLGIWVAVFALMVAILAMPLRDSVLCRLFARIGMNVCS
jgi:hypothetical protein